MDTASTTNYIQVGSISQLQHTLLQKNARLNISTLEGNNAHICDLVQFTLCTKNNDWAYVVNAYVKPSFHPLTPVHITNSEIYKLCNDDTIDLNENYPRLSSVNVDIILGISSTMAILGNKKIPLSQELALLSTKWGYTLAGSGSLSIVEDEPNMVTSAYAYHVSYFTKTEQLIQQMEKMWTLEKMPFDDDKSGLTHEEVQAVNKINEVMTYNKEQKCFETKLLFKGAPKFQNNIKSAKARLYNMIRSIKDKPSVIKAYKDTVMDYLSSNIIEEVHDEHAYDLTRTDLFYLPYRILYDPTRESTVHRIVFDASAKCPQGNSLNSCIMCGPKLQQDILAILIRFRSSKYIINADISKMFLNCKIKGNDRNFLRFLFQDPTDDTNTIKIYRFTTLCFGVKDAPYQSITCIQKLVQMKLKDPNITQYERRACDIITRDFYVDDCIHACDTVEEAIHTRKALTDILAQGSFHIRKWVANDQRIIDSIPEQDRAKLFTYTTLLGTTEKQADTTSALGYTYNPFKDQFIFNSYELLIQKNENDMRSVASLLASLYDPLGIISPFVLLARKILKYLYEQKLTWNDKVPKEILSLWADWCHQVKFLQNLSIPRYISTSNESIYLVCADASLEGFGCCTHVRTPESGMKRYEVNLLFAKSRVAPIANLTIPRLELKAALLAARMAQYIHIELKVPKERIFLYTDSEIVLFWLQKRPETLIPFVSNRISKIHDLEFSFSYINTQHNPADIASRGISVEDMIDNKLWFHGPGFWKLPKDQWPKETKDYSKLPTMEGIKRQHIFSYTTIAQISSIDQQPQHDERTYMRLLINTPCMDYKKLIQRVALVIFIQDRLLKLHSMSYVNATYEQFMPYKNRALLYWIRVAQNSEYSSEIKTLRSKKSLTPNSSLFKHLPFLDEDHILRLVGRLQESIHHTYDQKHPIILPKNHYFTYALVHHLHINDMHLSNDSLYWKVKDRFWIPQSRRLISQVIKRCVSCSKFNAVKATQIMAPNPRPRLQIAQPWIYVGVDLTGALPILIKKSKLLKVSDLPPDMNKVKYSPPTENAYIVLFTCLSTRAIHLEIVLSNYAEEFLNSFLRFVSLNGTCLHLYSDNATYFQKAKNKLYEERSRVNSKLGKFSQVEFTWHFQTPVAGHVGGLWERMIKMVKQSLQKSIRHTKLTYYELLTTIRLIQAAINDRPLTKLSEDATDTLTPSKLIFGRKLVPWIDNYVANKPSVIEDITIRWKLRQKITNQIWNDFLKQYLLELQTRSKWFTDKPNLKIGDIVIVEKKNIKRHYWPTMRVVDVNVGRDGKVRSVKLYKAYEKQPYLTRTIHQVYPLEAVNAPNIDFPQQMHEEKLVLTSEQAAALLQPGKENEINPAQ